MPDDMKTALKNLIEKRVVVISASRQHKNFTCLLKYAIKCEIITALNC